MQRPARTILHNVRFGFTGIGKRAFLENPTCDGLYIGGGSWFVANVAQQLEQEFRKPVISNQPAIVWDVMHKLGDWTPSPQHGNLMGSA